MAPFLFSATRRLLRESFADPSEELPRRIAAKPQLYGLVRAAALAALAAPAEPALDGGAQAAAPAGPASADGRPRGIRRMLSSRSSMGGNTDVSKLT